MTFSASDRSARTAEALSLRFKSAIIHKAAASRRMPLSEDKKTAWLRVADAQDRLARALEMLPIDAYREMAQSSAAEE